MVTFPSNTKEIIDDIREAIGREFTIVAQVSGISCPLCSLDPVTSLSVNTFCSGCGGTYWINTLSGYTLLGHVHWTSSEQPLWQPGGKIMEGDCTSTITYSGAYLNLLENADYCVVDN